MLLLVAVVALVAAPLAAQSDAPKAVLDRVIHDFGEIVRSEVAEHGFEIRNEGGSDLLIREVQTTCACTVVDFPRAIAAGDSGEVRIALDTDFVEGAFQAQAFLYTNDPEKPRIDLTLKVQTTPYLTADPGYVRYVVPRHFEGDATVVQRIEARSPADFRITRVESPYPFVETRFWEATAEERAGDHQGPQWLVETQLSRDAPVGPLAGYLRVHTDHARQKELSIPLSGFVRPLYSLTPAVADLGEVEVPQDGVRTSLHLKQFGQSPIRIERAETDVEGIEVSIEEINEGREFWVHLQLSNDLPRGPFAGEVVITTSSEHEPTLRTRLEGTVVRR